jgi:hypothetical protein
VRRRLVSGLAAAVGLALVPAGLGASASPTQVGPEYGIVLSTMAGGFTASKPVFTCPGPDVTAITEAVEGPAAVEKLGFELVEQTLGSKEKPWPRNHRAFTYQGKQWVPDFVKGDKLFVVVTGRPLDLAEIRGLQAIARANGRELVVVTRKNAAITSALSKATSTWWKRSAGRVHVLRCI